MPAIGYFASATPVLLRVGTAVTAIVLASCASAPPQVQRGPIGYVTDPAGNVVRNATGQCFRTGYWQPEYAVKECDPELVQAQAPAEKSPEVAAAPEPTAPTESTESTTALAEEPEQAPAEPVRVYVGTDAYFPFNQAELTAQAKRNLDAIAQRAQDADDASIRVVGYSDQIGDDSYNVSLSQRRADAVRVYLVERGVPETIVSTEALGETDPIVGCEGRQGASLIDCLQPNRRTEVEFSALETPQ